MLILEFFVYAEILSIENRKHVAVIVKVLSTDLLVPYRTDSKAA